MSEWEEIHGCIGTFAAADGSHIRIEEPMVCDWEYFNYKSFYSVVLRAVVDASGNFLDASCQWPGRVGDQRVWENSGIYAQLVQWKDSGFLDSLKVELQDEAGRPFHEW